MKRGLVAEPDQCEVGLEQFPGVRLRGEGAGAGEFSGMSAED